MNSNGAQLVGNVRKLESYRFMKFVVPCVVFLCIHGLFNVAASITEFYTVEW
jgi:hypothetical protein